MGGLDTKRLVLVRTISENSSGDEKYLHGTGYFLTKDLVLTAGHVLGYFPSEISVRLETPQDRETVWLKAESVPVWEDKKLDVALLKIMVPIHDVDLPQWGHELFDQDVKWNSVAYPVAATEETEEGIIYKSVGLTGTLYPYGGGGQGRKELDLGVEYESEDEWKGISGAPIFVGDKLVGIIISYKTGFGGKRLEGIPIVQLLNEPAFQLTINPQWLLPFPSQLWTMILISEDCDDGFSDKIKTAYERRLESINRAASLPPETKPSFLEVIITEVLKEPTHWYETIKALCAAPIVVVDVTNYQPAIMLLLGIRAVVRRGVTIAVTSAELDENSLSKLPFNIQEIKLIYPLPNLEIIDPRHPINRIGDAVVKGLSQLRDNPGYLDLPAFEAVRSPKPQILSTEIDEKVSSDGVVKKKDIATAKSEPERILMLCSFHEEYWKHWLYVSEKIIMTFRGVGKSLERMIDISSPRLVGQALYEGIRWTPCCIVDWTHWRPNVFFELGVRLACSDIGPVNLIDENEISMLESGSNPVQKERLLQLFQPKSYKLFGPLGPFKDSFERYSTFLKNCEKILDPETTISHNATYRMVVSAYDWRQEIIAKMPHEELRASVEVQQGKDPERDGYQALFSSNTDLQREIQRNGRERWIAAWCYFRKRFVPEDLESEEFRNNEAIKEQLSVLTERVVQELRNQSDPFYERIYKEAVALIDKLDELYQL
jgi:hypothetical protein